MKFRSQNQEYVFNYGISAGLTMLELESLYSQAKNHCINRLIQSIIREYKKELIDETEKWKVDLQLNLDAGFTVYELSENGNGLIFVCKLSKYLRKAEVHSCFGLSQLKKINDFAEITNIMSLIDEGNADSWNNLASLLTLNFEQYFLVLVQKEIFKKSNKSITSIYHETNKDMQLVYFEQWTVTGHQLHPLTKLKSDMVIEDLEKYSPESHKTIHLIVSFLSKKKSISKKIDDSIHDATKLVRNDDSIKIEDYAVIPIHPWQYENIVKPNINTVLDHDDLLISSSTVSAYPLISFRSLYSPDLELYIKLPVSTKITSGIRSLSPRPCTNGIVLSKIFRQLEDIHETPDSFHFQKELLSNRLDEKYPNGSDLSVIYREPLNSYVDKTDLILPMAALFEEGLLRPESKIIDEIVTNHSKIFGNEITKSALDIFDKYLEISMFVFVKLLVKYGLGIEGHLQNTVLVFKNYVPHKLILRDPDAISVNIIRLRENFPNIKFYKDSWTVSESMEDANNKLMHSYFHSSINEFVNHLRISYNIDEIELWDMVKDKLDFALKLLTKEDVPSEYIQELRRFFGGKNTQIKSLLKMKIEDRTKDYIFTEDLNPLYSE